MSARAFVWDALKGGFLLETGDLGGEWALYVYTGATEKRGLMQVEHPVELDLLGIAARQLRQEGDSDTKVELPHFRVTIELLP